MPAAADQSGQDFAVPAAAPDEQAQPASSQVSQSAENLAMITSLALVALLVAMAIGAYFLLRRRKSEPAVPTVTRPAVERRQPLPSEQAPASAPVAAAAASDRTEGFTDAAALETPRETEPALAAEGAAVPLPREMPESFEERDALLKRMVDAEPDRANPFRSRKARARRARLILQSLGRKFDGREPWIDLSQYRNNWPNLSGRNYSPA